MTTSAPHLELLDDPVAQELLQSRYPAKLAYTWTDGSPRVVPIWFHWNGKDIVLSGPPDAPKVRALRANSRVAMTIDGDVWPYKALLIRGTAELEPVEGVPDEYAAAARRYFGVEQGDAWVSQAGQLSRQSVRIRMRPEWVRILDFQTRFPSAIARAMAAARQDQGGAVAEDNR